MGITGGETLLTMGVAALASGSAQSVINEAESYLRGDKQLNESSLEDSAMDIGINAMENSALNFVGNFTGANSIHTDINWTKPSSWKSFFDLKYGQKVLMQTSVGSIMSLAWSQTEYSHNMYSDMDSDRNHVSCIVAK